MDEKSNLHVDRIEKSPQVPPLSLITLSCTPVSPASVRQSFYTAWSLYWPDEEINGMNIRNWLLAHFTGIEGTPPLWASFSSEDTKNTEFNWQVRTKTKKALTSNHNMSWMIHFSVYFMNICCHNEGCILVCEIIELMISVIRLIIIEIHFNSSHLQNSRIERGRSVENHLYW